MDIVLSKNGVKCAVFKISNVQINLLPESFNTNISHFQDPDAPEGEDTMKNLRKTFAGIFGDLQ